MNGAKIRVYFVHLFQGDRHCRTIVRPFSQEAAAQFAATYNRLGAAQARWASISSQEVIAAPPRQPPRCA